MHSFLREVVTSCCDSASDKSIFRGLTPHFRSATLGNSTSNGFTVDRDVSAPELNRDM